MPHCLFNIEYRYVLDIFADFNFDLGLCREVFAILRPLDELIAFIRLCLDYICSRLSYILGYRLRRVILF